MSSRPSGLVIRRGAMALIGLMVALILPSQLYSQRDTSSKEVLSNRDVIELVSAQLPTDVILAKIASSTVAFDLTTSGLIELNRGKVPSEIVKAMISRSSVGQPESSSASAPPAESAETSAPGSSIPPGSEVARPSEPGIYMYADSAGRRTLRMLEPSAYSSGRSGGRLQSALTYGLAKTKTKAIVRGEEASVRTLDRRPVFFFVFERTNGGLSGSSGLFFDNGVTSPNEFTLIRLNVSQGVRETVVLSANVFGSSSGTSDKDVVPFRFTRLMPGFYRVHFEQDVEPGEYSFLSAAGQQLAGSGITARARLWDFGIR